MLSSVYGISVMSAYLPIADWALIPEPGKEEIVKQFVLEHFSTLETHLTGAIQATLLLRNPGAHHPRHSCRLALQKGFHTDPPKVTARRG
jgi:hypothetical protein